MIEIRLGDRYAKSILDLAIERGELDLVQKDFQFIDAVCKSNPDFVRMLKSPLINPDRKQKILDEIFADKFSPITKNLVEIVVRKKREAYLRDIAVRFLHQYDRHKNITRGTLATPHPLSDAHRVAIRKMVEQELTTTFMMDEKTDPELIGGFTLRIGDNMFDGSIATRLRELSQEFDENPYVKEL